MRKLTLPLLGAMLAMSTCLVSCDQNRKPLGRLDCTPTGDIRRLDSLGMRLLPANKWVPLSADTTQVQTLNLGRQGQYSLMMTFGQTDCKGSSTLEIRTEDASPSAPHLALNLIYQGKKADTDTLSVLGLLPFEGKVLRCTEVFPDEAKRSPRLLCRLKIQ